MTHYSILFTSTFHSTPYTYPSLSLALSLTLVLALPLALVPIPTPSLLHPPDSYQYPPPSPPSSPATWTPGNTRYSCYHHLFDSCDPGLLPISRHRSIMGQVYMYCVTIFCHMEIYISISSKTTSLIASPKGGYSHITSTCFCGIFSKIRLVTIWLKPTKFSSWGGLHSCLQPKQ